VAVHEFIAAMRELRRPLVVLAVAILVLQSFVTGLGSPAAARIAAGGLDLGTICHGNGDPAGPTPAPAAHDCCFFCTTNGPAALACSTHVIARLDGLQPATPAIFAYRVVLLPRAIRAAPSQAPPLVA
jgi:hypothetical protein